MGPVEWKEKAARLREREKTQVQEVKVHAEGEEVEK